jgi:DNA polymerase-1
LNHSFANLRFECTATMARLSNNRRPAGLKYLAARLLGARPMSYAEAKNAAPEVFQKYAADDALHTFELYPVLRRELEEKGLAEIYEIEKQFLLVNLECQRNGLPFNSVAAAIEIQRLKNQIEMHKASLDDPNMNWNSPKQLQRKLFGEYQLPLVYQKGKISTGKRALKLLAHDTRIQTLLELKKSESLLRQIRTLEKFSDPSTDRIHPFINPLGADTGRATSSCPNLQNIEKKSILRSIFAASAGRTFIVLDFSQIEPRVLAHYLPDSTFALLFDAGGDFYEKIAKSLGLTKANESFSRDVAKQVVLATFYGMRERTLSENLKITKEEAARILNEFFKGFPEIQNFRDKEIQAARRNGYVLGLLNRRRYIEGLNDVDDRIRFKAERQVLNSIVQGSAATLFKYKLVQLRNGLPRSVRFLHHVHDEVILECAEDNAGNVLEESKRILELPVEWFRPQIQVEGGMGKSWAIAKGK